MEEAARGESSLAVLRDPRQLFRFSESDLADFIPSEILLLENLTRFPSSYARSITAAFRFREEIEWREYWTYISWSGFFILFFT